MADPICTACAQPVDLAVPHRTLIEQRETEQDGVVSVLAVVDEPRYRHDECPAGSTVVAECPECGQDVPATLAPGVAVPDSSEDDQRAAEIPDARKDPAGRWTEMHDECHIIVEGLRAELAETRAAGEVLDDVLGALLRELAPIPWGLYEDATVARDRWDSVRGPVPVPAPDRAGDDQPREARP